MRVGHAAQRVAAAVVLVITMGVAQSQPMPNVASDDAPERRSFAIVDVTTFDGVAFRWDQDVWIDNGRIRAVGQALELPGNPLRIDGRGRTLMPGLIDSHVHAFGTALHDALRFGVTSVLDQGNEPTAADSKRAARETLAPGDEADFFTAGMLATATGGHGTHVDMAVEPVRGQAEAESWVQARKAEGSDWIKIVYEDGLAYGPAIPTLDRETIRALIAAAHAEDLLAVMHVSTLDHALEAVELGANGLVHVWGDALLDDVQAARIAEAGVFVVPTLTVLAARGSRYSAMSDAAIENVRHLHAAGVSLLAGTDAPNVGTAFGVSLHGELKLLVRAGLSNAEGPRGGNQPSSHGLRYRRPRPHRGRADRRSGAGGGRPGARRLGQHTDHGHLERRLQAGPQLPRRDIGRNAGVRDDAHLRLRWRHRIQLRARLASDDGSGARRPFDGRAFCFRRNAACDR